MIAGRYRKYKAYKYCLIIGIIGLITFLTAGIVGSYAIFISIDEILPERITIPVVILCITAFLSGICIWLILDYVKSSIIITQNSFIETGISHRKIIHFHDVTNLFLKEERTHALLEIHSINEVISIPTNILPLESLVEISEFLLDNFDHITNKHEPDLPLSEATHN